MNDLWLYRNEILKAFGESGIMMGLSMVLGFSLGLLVGILIYLTRPGGLLKKPWLSFILNGYVNIVRSFPFFLFIFAMIPVSRFLIGTSFGTLASVVPLTFVAIALFARFVEQSLLEIPYSVVESALSMGATLPQLVIKFLLVEARSSLILGLTSATISLFSYSTVMGSIGGGGLGTFALIYGYQKYNWTLMWGVIVIILIFVMLMQWAGTSLARILNKH